MIAALTKLWRFFESDEGPTTTEYAVMLAVIAIAVIAAMATFGTNMGNLYTILTTTLSVF